MFVSIQTKIEILLSSETSGLSARELALALKLDKKSINSILYQNLGTVFRMTKIDSVPVWCLINSADLETEGAWERLPTDQNSTAASKPETRCICAVCGELAQSFLCSRRCEDRAKFATAKRILEPKSFANIENLVNFAIHEPTAPLRQIKLAFEDVALVPTDPHGPSLLELWEHNKGDLAKTIDQIRTSFEVTRDFKETDTQAVSHLKIAIPNLSQKHRSEVLRALQRNGVTATRISSIEISVLLHLRDLSEGARRNIENLANRRTRLHHALLKRNIDALTLDYLGVTSELCRKLDLADPVSIEELELRGRERLHRDQSNLCQEFDELVLAAGVHPFLPTSQIVENLEVWIPSVIINAEIPYLQRLRTALQNGHCLASDGAINRVIRMISLLENLFSGGTLEVLGSNAGVTRERIRQQLEPIIGFCGVSNLRELRDFAQREALRREAHDLDKVSNRAVTISSYIREHPGVFKSELNARFPSDIEAVEIACQEHPALILDSDTPYEDFETRDRRDIIESLQAASLLSFPLTGSAYDQLLAEGYVKGVSRVRILQVFGTWVEACRRAEVEPGEHLKNVEYVRKFSELEMIRVVGQFLLDDDNLGRAGGVHSYGPWRDVQEFSDSLPSAGTIRNQVHSSWKVVKRLALQELRKTWTQHDGHNSEVMSDVS